MPLLVSESWIHRKSQVLPTGCKIPSVTLDGQVPARGRQSSPADPAFMVGKHEICKRK